jgi:hypothetical protein
MRRCTACAEQCNWTFCTREHRRRVILATQGTRQWQATKKIINLFWAFL